MQAVTKVSSLTPDLLTHATLVQLTETLARVWRSITETPCADYKTISDTDMAALIACLRSLKPQTFAGKSTAAVSGITQGGLHAGVDAPAKVRAP
jgi:hypothetical protein